VSGAPRNAEGLLGNLEPFGFKPTHYNRRLLPDNDFLCLSTTEPDIFVRLRHERLDVGAFTRQIWLRAFANYFQLGRSKTTFGPTMIVRYVRLPRIASVTLKDEQT
jgi:hypothetical protein